MAVRGDADRITEFGDFQTPIQLARRVCKLLSRRNVKPASIIEPTCGTGSFIIAALDEFPGATTAFGLDVNRAHLAALRSALAGRRDGKKACIAEGSFFETDWPAILRGLPEPLLVIGNPPWVTNTELGSLGSSNLPKKTNFKRHAGLDALTGKSNFDISEWMLLRFVEWLNGRRATLAVLCKTAVARKVLEHAWTHGVSLAGSNLFLVDANTSFGAAVDACLLVCTFEHSGCTFDSVVYRSITDDTRVSTIGFRDGHLLADSGAYERWKHLQGEDGHRWRSGIKHDCAKVMELRKEGDRYRNGLNELVELEEDFVYPMVKGSAVAKGGDILPARWMLVTQRSIGDDTTVIAQRAPKTWEYLSSHAALLHRRASSIYRNRPPFCVFGVGDYSFAPWKVAISSLHKKLVFTQIGSFAGKPIVLDDTCYFLPFETKEGMRLVGRLLNSSAAREFFSAFLFWDAKRPVTAGLLQRLDLVALARQLGCEDKVLEFIRRPSQLATSRPVSGPTQRRLF